MKRILTCVVCALLALTNVITLFSSCKEHEPVYTPESPYVREDYNPSNTVSHNATSYIGDSYNISFADTLTLSYYKDCYIVKGKKITSNCYYWKENGLGFYKDMETFEYDKHSMLPDDNYEEKFFGGYTETTVEITEVLSAPETEIQQGDTLKLIENYTIDINGVIAEVYYKIEYEEYYTLGSGPEYPELLKKDTTYLFILRKEDLITEESGIISIKLDFLLELRWWLSFHDTFQGMGKIPTELLYGTYISYRAYELSEEAQSRAETHLREYTNYFDKSDDEEFDVNNTSENPPRALYYKFLYEANEMYRKNDQ